MIVERINALLNNRASVNYLLKDYEYISTVLFFIISQVFFLFFCLIIIVTSNRIIVITLDINSGADSQFNVN